MQNHVTPATAQRLKDAGFQQKADIFDFWYFERNNMLAVCNGIDQYSGVFVYPLGELKISEDLFAPTATDILRELGSDYSICSFKISKVQWEVERRMMAGFDVLPFTWIHENPAEAAALAWLSKHEKKCPK